MTGITRRDFIALGVAAPLVLSGCSSNQEEQINYMDDKAITILENGFKKRSDYITTNDTGDAKGIKGAVEAELGVDEELRTAAFEDTELQKVVLSYLNALDGQIDCLDTYAFDSEEFYTKWQEVYDKRSQILATLVDEYGF